MTLGNYFLLALLFLSIKLILAVPLPQRVYYKECETMQLKNLEHCLAQIYPSINVYCYEYGYNNKQGILNLLLICKDLRRFLSFTYLWNRVGPIRLNGLSCMVALQRSSEGLEGGHGRPAGRHQTPILLKQSCFDFILLLIFLFE